MTRRIVFSLVLIGLGAGLLAAPFLSLNADDVLNAGGITVYGDLQPTASQTIVITKKDIEKYSPPDVASLLEQALGLDMTGYGYSGGAASPELRGVGSGRVAVLVDGVSVASPQSGEVDLSMLNVHSIERVEVVYGAGEELNVSGAMGGIINIITIPNTAAPGIQFGFDVSAVSFMYNLFDTLHSSAYMQGGGDVFSWKADVFYNRSENHYTFKIADVEYLRTGAEMFDVGLGAAFTWKLSDWTRIVLKDDAYYGDRNIPGNIYSVGHGVQKDVSNRFVLSMDKPTVVIDDLEMHVSVSHTYHVLNFEEDAAASNHHAQKVSASNTWEWHILSWLNAKAGLDYNFGFADSTNVGQVYSNNGSVAFAAGMDFFNKALLLKPALKLVISDTGSPVVPVPSLGLRWQPLPGLALRNTYYRAYKLPTFNDRYWSGDATAEGNPDLKPEDAWGGDVGVQYAYKDWVTVDGSAYATWVKDSIHWRYTNSKWSPVNIGEAVLFGATANVKSAIPIKNAGILTHFAPSLTYEFLMSYILTEENTFKSDIRMPYMPMHRAVLNLELGWSGGSFILSGKFEGLRYTETLNITTLPAYFLLNASVRHEIIKGFVLYANALNMLKTGYMVTEDYPAPGFSIAVGTRLSF
jgi:outer membrane receptor protein involved in Fe transport